MDASLVRQRLQDELSSEFQLLSVQPVPVFGPSLSQELTASRWSFGLQAALSEATTAPTPSQWQRALQSVLSATSLIWHDTDKKGRPRERECRPDLRSVVLQSMGSVTGAVSTAPSNAMALFQLEAAIDEQGRSIRPQQVQVWLEQHLEQPLLLRQVRREALILQPC